MFPDSTPALQRSPRRLRPALWLSVVGAAAVTGLIAGLVFGRPAETVPFPYMHGALSAPATSAPGRAGPVLAEVVFRLIGSRGQQTFTLAQLQALPAVQYRATQPQLKRSFVYTGVPLRDLARLAGLSGQNLRVLADDQFGATIQAADYDRFPLMLAYLADGRPITAAQKGPLEVVFPNEQERTRFQNFGSQWVWFATALEAAP
ncbi:hypothetical protein Q0M94_07610 [Deinococcus radiomollis]|uniref:hypothetical protein n=1 Tax=Deinococcus radiomollis TaxID=468916 RepID=UPI0038927D9D